MNSNKFKLPNVDYLYFMERHGKPYDGAKFEVIIEDRKYDVIPSNKQYSLGLISDMIVNLTTKGFDKVNPGKELQYADELKKQLGIEVNQLLLD